MKLVIVAQSRAKPGHEAALEAALSALVAPTRAEAGCETYDLHRGRDDPGLFHFHEVWTTREHWLAHIESAHIAACRAATKDIVAERQLWEFDQIA